VDADDGDTDDDEGEADDEEGDADDGEVDGEGDADDDEVEGDGDAEDDEVDGDGDEVDGDGDGDGDAEDEDDAEDDADADGDADAGADELGSTDGTAAGLRNEEEDEPCSTNGVTWPECLEGRWPAGEERTAGDELMLSGACDVEAGPAAAAPASDLACPAGGDRTPVRMTVTAAPAASTAPAAHAGADPQDRRRRSERPPRPLPGHGSAGGTTCVTDPPCVPDTTCILPSLARRRLASGRASGCLARQPSTSRRSSTGRPRRSAGLLTSRYISAELVPEPNGSCPRHAKTRTAPKLKMSLAGPASWPRTCSGDKNPGEPPPSSSSSPDAAARPSPKPVSHGPFSASTT